MNSDKIVKRYTRINTIDISDVFDRMKNFYDSGVSQSKTYRVDFDGYLANIASLRLKTFYQKGICCIECGIKAEYFALEKDYKNSKMEFYHLNLYGLKGDKEILFTHDHTHARSLGGEDKIENTETMCEECNSLKSKVEAKLSKNYLLVLFMKKIDSNDITDINEYVKNNNFNIQKMDKALLTSYIWNKLKKKDISLKQEKIVHFVLSKMAQKLGVNEDKFIEKFEHSTNYIDLFEIADENFEKSLPFKI